MTIGQVAERRPRPVICHCTTLHGANWITLGALDALSSGCFPCPGVSPNPSFPWFLPLNILLALPGRPPSTSSLPSGSESRR